MNEKQRAADLEATVDIAVLASGIRDDLDNLVYYLDLIQHGADGASYAQDIRSLLWDIANVAHRAYSGPAQRLDEEAE